MKINLDNKIIEINKLPIGKYPEVIKLGREIFNYFSKFDTLNNEVLLNELPGIIEKNIPTINSILIIATPLKEGDFDEFGLYEYVEVIMAVIEVNRFVDIYNRIKKGLALPEQAKAMKPIS